MTKKFLHHSEVALNPKDWRGRPLRGFPEKVHLFWVDCDPGDSQATIKRRARAFLKKSPPIHLSSEAMDVIYKAIGKHFRTVQEFMEHQGVLR